MINKNIYLIGLPNSGKTTIGKYISKMSGFDFLDTDEAAENEAGISIEKIFQIHGQKYFRELETKVLKEAAGKTHTVVSAGGGAVLSEENRNIMKQSGIVIYIKRDIETLAKYASYENRPLLKSIDDLKKLFSQRKNIYIEASNIEFYIDEWSDNLFEYVSNILILINEYQNKNLKKLCVIGSPIEHSLSPFIHNSIYRIEKINAVYTPIQVSVENISSFLEYAKKNIYGFNATMPNKEKIIKYIDELHETKNSVNTVIYKNGKLAGTSTDGFGFLYALKNIDIKNKNIAILGSGGAAYSIYETCQRHGANVCVISRDKNEALKKYDNVYSYQETDSVLSNCDILVNACPLGMYGFEDFDNLSFLKKLPKKSIVFDSVYNPSETSFLTYAKNINLQTIEGVYMLLGQAFHSSMFWFGKMPEEETQKEISCNIRKYLR